MWVFDCGSHGLCDKVCGQKWWKRGFAAGVGRGAFESFDLVPLKHKSRGSQVIELSVQHNNKLNVRLQSVTRVIV